MPTYYHKYSWIEDGYGVVEHLVTISNSYQGLFQLEDAKEVTNFSVENIEKKSDKLVGGIIESKLSFTFNNHKNNSSNEIDFYDLLMTAKNPEVKIFIAKFINANENPSGNNIQFYGLVSPDFETEDLRWHGQKFSSSPNPIKVVKGSASPYSIAIIESIEFEDLVNGNAGKNVVGISNEWEEVNVKDGQGWFDWSEKNRKVMIGSLVSLNSIIKKLALNLTQTLINQGYGTLNFVFDKCELDGYFHPARWVHSLNRIVLPEYNKADKYPRYNYCMSTTPDTRPGRQEDRLFSESIRGSSGYQTYSSDKHKLFIDPDGNSEVDTMNLNESIFLNYRLLKNDDTDPLFKENEKHTITKKCKNFYDFLEKIAFTFGIYINLEMINADTLKVSFIPKSNFKNNDFIYIRTPVKAGIRISNNLKDNASKVKAKSNAIADEGQSYYNKKGNISNKPQLKQIELKNLSTDSDSILLSISPTTVIYDEVEMAEQKAEDDGRIYTLAIFPHNTYFAGNKIVDGETKIVKENKVYGDSIGLHTALYMFVNSNTDPTHFTYFADMFSTPDNYFTPVGAYSIQINGALKRYYKISDFINELLQLDSDSNIYEYNLEIPAYYGFSDSEGGTNLDWRLLNIGAKIEIDGQTYTVIEIKWDSDKPNVKIKLHGTSKFDYSNPSNFELETTDSFNYNSFVNYNENKICSGYASETINELQVVVIDDENAIYPAYADGGHYHKNLGIALNSVNAGEVVGYITSGTITIPSNWDDLNIGKDVFLKYVNQNRNISHEIPQPGNNLYENLIVQIGKAIDKRSIQLYNGFPERYEYSSHFWGNPV